ncbi:V-type proton ATPase subunit E [Oxobacter pfennigii]|uniref:V-type proton ATPase subunit E n=1 Tax=Oxobacter pfennigii TaxID=36849 RepID=A0A0P8WQ45_9CLOT|nr:FliH/SctL family protein [Oxobacter pfennigii]KPU44689.1 V-type proton ATPase subunit E [Oxobacter pfennigii]
MQSSYKVIKKNFVNSDSIYTINTPVIEIAPLVIKPEALNEVNEEVIGQIDLEEIKKQAYEKAESIINEATAKSEKIAAEAMEEAVRIKKDAYEMAFRKGHSEGFKKGNEEGHIAVENIRLEAKDVLEEAHRVSREYINNQKGEILNLAINIAEKIIGYAADENDSVIYTAAMNAINSAIIKEQLIIRVNPMDYALLDYRRDEILSTVGENLIVSIIKDASISRGGLILESEASTVDATIESQMEKIKEALIG